LNGLDRPAAGRPARCLGESTSRAGETARDARAKLNMTPGHAGKKGWQKKSAGPGFSA